MKNSSFQLQAFIPRVLPMIFGISSFIIFISSVDGYAQHMEVEGKLKVSDMEVANGENMLVVQQGDGTLAVREAATIADNAASTYAVGDYAQGGVVFYVDPSGKHGKVLYIHQMGFVNWSNVEAYNDGAKNPKNGAGNTSAIIQQEGHIQSAASLCAEMAYGGYDDWYLPGITELILLYNERVAVDQVISNIDGEILGTTAYWSSQESSSDFTKAYALKFSDGSIALGTKSGYGNVRAIRSF